VGTKRLIVTGDDFGAAVSVNEAIELAHRSGILTTTCLLVGGLAADEAVARARRMPRLRVGLHVAVTDARPVLPPSEIPLLVDERGQLSGDLLISGLRFYGSRSVQAQLRAEIRAQFEAFAATGLALDHVNGHNHLHIHPTVLGSILDIGKDYGVRAMRVPYEPFLPSWRSAHRDLAARFCLGVGLAPMIGAMRARLRRAGVRFNDFLFGICDTGRMTSERALAILRQLPEGTSEIHFHPATSRWPGMPAWARCEEELAALTNPELGQALHDLGIESTTF
jgi:hopanoid biosynthesis associated protein HpnK